MYQINFNKPVNDPSLWAIGGISMSGLAEILHAKGFTVVGSDAHESAITDHLTSLGIQICLWPARMRTLHLILMWLSIQLPFIPDNPEFAAA